MVGIKIFNVRVYGIDESIIASGYPMLTEIKSLLDTEVTFPLQNDLHGKRAIKLANTPTGSGHSNFLKGIIVQADFEAPSYWWPQAQRYHWFEIISSQSKMHRIVEMDINTYCGIGTRQESIEIAINSVDLCATEPNLSIENILANVPMGLELTARVSTNYLCLKNMYAQRKNHELIMWHKVFTDFVKGLPCATEFLIGGR